jgi:hypothetical protein
MGILRSFGVSTPSSGEERGPGVRDRAIIEVISGRSRIWLRITFPTEPVAPAMRSFMVEFGRLMGYWEREMLMLRVEHSRPYQGVLACILHASSSYSGPFAAVTGSAP